MENLSEHLQQAEKIGLAVHFAANGDISNKAKVRESAKQLDVRAACHDFNEMLDVDNNRLPNTNILLGIAIAHNIQREQLDRDIKKFNESWAEIEARQRQRRPRGQATTGTDKEPDYVTLLEQELEIPDLLELPQPADKNQLQETELPSAVVDDYADLGSFGDFTKEADVDVMPMAVQLPSEPQDAGESTIAFMPEIPEIIVQEASDAPAQPALPVMARRAVIVPRGDVVRRRRPRRAEEEEAEAAFAADAQEFIDLEDIGEVVGPHTLPRFRFIRPSLVGSDEFSENSSSGLSSIQNGNGRDVVRMGTAHELEIGDENQVVGQTMLDPTCVLHGDDVASVEEVQELSAGFQLLDMKELGGYGKPVYVTQWKRWLLGKCDELRGRSWKLPEIAPQPPNRFNTTVAFMAVMQLLREDVVKITCSSKGYLKAIEFL